MSVPNFTIADVLAWARTKPADERYCYNSNGRCALAQFLVATGRSVKPNVGSSTWSELAWDATDHAIDPRLDAAVFAGDTEERWTFGALVSRLEALIPAKTSSWLNPQTYVDADCGEYVA